MVDDLAGVYVCTFLRLLYAAHFYAYHHSAMFVCMYVCIAPELTCLSAEMTMIFTQTNHFINTYYHYAGTSQIFAYASDPSLREEFARCDTILILNTEDDACQFSLSSSVTSFDCLSYRHDCSSP